jgi:hypothetical protein
MPKKHSQVCSRWIPVSLIRSCYKVMADEVDFEKANEIYFRLGIIYKHQKKYPASLEVSSSQKVYP